METIFNWRIGRIVTVYKGKYRVVCENQEFLTEVTGNFINKVQGSTDFPTVGDWVEINDQGYIMNIKDRKNYLSRKVSGKRNDEQLMAANVDRIFILTSLNKEFNVERIDRYISLAYMHSIQPLIVFTKTDLCNNIWEYERQIFQRFPDITVIPVSVLEDRGIDKLMEYMSPGMTSVFIGSSGVGKSTLVNRLLKNCVMKTSEIRKGDDKGRHTTTNRQLFELSNGSYVIDTPGIREVGGWISEVDSVAFDDIEQIARDCKYSNCRHISEKGCAVLYGVQTGQISKERYDSYQKYQKEVYYASLIKNIGERKKFKSLVKQQCKNERYVRR